MPAVALRQINPQAPTSDFRSVLNHVTIFVWSTAKLMVSSPQPQNAGRLQQSHQLRERTGKRQEAKHALASS